MLRKQLEVNNILLWLLIIASGIAYYSLGYQTNRDNFQKVAILFLCLFTGYYLLYKHWNKNYTFLNFIGILFRVILIASFPNLSDDIYRFLWDGKLFVNGINPFLYLPTEVIELNQQGIDHLHFDQLNSKNYFTIYPPFLQYCFGAAAYLFPTNLLNGTFFLKLLILLSEIGSIVLITKLLKTFKIDQKYSVLYSLNPLVIIELAGNVHFEAFMIFFLLLAVNLLSKKKYWTSAVYFALAVSSKLLPLMFLPFLWRRIGLRKTVIYSLIVFSLNAVLFIPFISTELFVNMFSSVSLYFEKFEFNASAYYIIRWIGFEVKGYNIIKDVGLSLSITVFVIIIILTFKERLITIKNLPVSMLTALSFYFLFATTIHPWYIATLVALTPFVKSRFAVVWSASAVLSYFTYSSQMYIENLWFVSAEYFCVFAFLFYEWRTNKIFS